MERETNVDMNGNIKEENNMSEVSTLLEQAAGEAAVSGIMVNGIDLAELVAQAAEEAKYSGLKSFFVTDDGAPKDYFRVGDYFFGEGEYRISDAAYIIPRDKEKEEFAVVTRAEKPQSFTYLNRTGKDFIRRIKEIAKSQHMSIAKILETVPVYVQVVKKMRKGHEEEQFMELPDGTFNWFYDYIITVKR